ncbi:MAG TPA: VWA domain-containing protein [Luteibaculaceae bacterium]|nr:VWA domain-containing protein [Luteibaculaceae bacterium]
MNGYLFSQFIDKGPEKSVFDQLLDLFLELSVYTNGDVEETFSWMKEIDDEYHITTPDYTLADFRRDLEQKGYLQVPSSGTPQLGAKAEQSIRKRAFDQLFGQLKKGASGQHQTKFSGNGDEINNELRPFQFGDKLEQISMTDSFRNAQKNHGIDEFRMLENDLEVFDSQHSAQMATVLMIDISHSMILYGEDRITPAKKVAMALSEFITTRYPKDSLDVVVFGNDAWQIDIKDLPYLSVGPYHTNTVAGLELAMDLLRRRRHANKQIFMITDGKPTCIKENGQYYKNSNYGQDPKIIGKCLTLAQQCRKLRIPITTFMIARDPYLQEFVEQFTETNQGKAFFTGLKGLGDFILADYQKNKRRKL